MATGALSGGRGDVVTAQAGNGGRLSSKEGEALDLPKVGIETVTPTKAGITPSVK